MVSTIYGEIIENDKQKADRKSDGLHNDVNIRIGIIYKKLESDRIWLEISSFLEYSIDAFESLPVNAHPETDVFFCDSSRTGPSLRRRYP